MKYYSTRDNSYDDIIYDNNFINLTEKEVNRIKIDWDAFIEPVRKEDEGNDLWSVFNVVQEKLIEGDFDYTIGGKARKAREIKNFKQDMKINKELFELALDYC